MLKHQFRVIGAVLTLAAAVTAVVVLVFPAGASAGHPGGKGGVWYYTNDKGNKLKGVGEDELFNIVGKNLNHTVDVFCRQTKTGNDGTPPPTGVSGGPWDDVTDWDYGPDSKSLVDVDMDPDCGGGRSAILVEFDNGTPGDDSDDVYVKGPDIEVGPES
jgi:hypothetical protein